MSNFVNLGGVRLPKDVLVDQLDNETAMQGTDLDPSTNLTAHWSHLLMTLVQD
jgi:hypothetical protein